MTKIPEMAKIAKQIKTVRPETDAAGNEIAGKSLKMADYAFRNLSSLKTVILPNRVAVISQGAFTYCSSLEFVKIPASVTTIESLAFEDCDSVTLYIPKTVTTIENDIFGWSVMNATVYVEYEEYESPYGYYPGDMSWLGMMDPSMGSNTTFGATMPD